MFDPHSLELSDKLPLIQADGSAGDTWLYLTTLSRQLTSTSAVRQMQSPAAMAPVPAHAVIRDRGGAEEHRL